MVKERGEGLGGEANSDFHQLFSAPNIPNQTWFLINPTAKDAETLRRWG
jgi:hypothetical protein